MAAENDGDVFFASGLAGRVGEPLPPGDGRTCRFDPARSHAHLLLVRALERGVAKVKVVRAGKRRTMRVTRMTPREITFEDPAGG